MQESLAGMYPTSITRFAPELSSYPDLRSLCQIQVEQLAMQLPSIVVWNVYYDANQGKSRVGVDYLEEHIGSEAEISYLESELWWADSLPVLQTSELAIANNHKAYICPLQPQGTHPEYLLVLSYQPLSVHQRQCVEHTAQLISHYLAIGREYHRQKTEIQLLEQAIQRSEHQIRNSLALISLYAENLRLACPHPEMQDQVTVIRETAENLSTNLKSLVYCGQRAKLHMTSCDLRLILRESIQSCQPWLEEKHLHILYPSEPIILKVDRWQLKQVFDNLLSNAINFSPEGGIISWHWQVLRHTAIVQVRDRGPGLSPEDLTKAFVPFYAKRPGGTGLGLAIAQKIILDHHGSLWVDNLPEGGAQFSLTLPR